MEPHLVLAGQQGQAVPPAVGVVVEREEQVDRVVLLVLEAPQLLLFVEMVLLRLLNNVMMVIKPTEMDVVPLVQMNLCREKVRLQAEVDVP